MTSAAVRTFLDGILLPPSAGGDDIIILVLVARFHDDDVFGCGAKAPAPPDAVIRRREARASDSFMVMMFVCVEVRSEED